MKNKTGYPFLLTILIIVILLGLYYIPRPTINGFTPRRVNLLSDIEKKEPETSIIDTLLPPPPVKPIAVRDTIPEGMTCIIDYADSTQKGMSPLYKALDNCNERVIHIAWLGDSFVEADILTSDLRRMLQGNFGGCGVGLVDITSITHGMRPTVSHEYANWQTHAISDSTGCDSKRIGLSNKYFIPQPGAWVEGRLNRKNHPDSCYTASIIFNAPEEITLSAQINKGETDTFNICTHDEIQAKELHGNIRQVKWKVHQSDNNTTFYGMTFDGKNGVSLDNFGVRSSSGLTLRSIPLNRLHQLARLRPYDLIILQYGLNVATERGYDYNYYRKGINLVIEHLKEAYPHAGFLLIGVGDRKMKDEEGNLKTMPGVINLMRYQQKIAEENHIAFWNLYDAMQTEGGIEGMVNARPSQANLDYTHINFRGGKVLAKKLYEAIIFGKKQYDKGF